MSTTIPQKPKYLVYLTTGFHPHFAKLTELCVNSIRDNNDMSQLDICIMCDKNYTYLVERLNTKLFITDNNPTPVLAAMRKLEIFDLPGIDEYDQVMFLDSDIVVCGNLVPLFEEAAAVGKDRICAFEEDYKDPHRAPWFSMFTYEESQIQAMDAAGIRGINTGQFIFAPTPEMRGHFDAIRELARNHHGHSHYEQSYVNVYFNLRPDLTERQMLQKHVRIYPQFDCYDPSKVIVHFNGDGEHGPYIKLQKMQHYYDNFKQYKAQKSTAVSE